MDELKKLREEIDRIDNEIVNLFAKRFNVTREIAQVKKKINAQPLDEKRWKEMIEQRQKLAKELGLDDNFVNMVYTLIHAESIDIQKNILEKDE
jgi:chorismate mutase